MRAILDIHATIDEMRLPIDFRQMMIGLRGLRQQISTADAARLSAAMAHLRNTSLPDAYVDGLQDELFQMFGRLAPATSVSVYLAFYGTEDRASFLKIGIAKDVPSRMANHATSNPLLNLWTYSAGFDKRRRAQSIEAALLKHMAPDKVHGEWVNVHGLSETAARAVVQSLSEVASAAHGSPVEFARGA